MAGAIDIIYDDLVEKQSHINASGLSIIRRFEGLRLEPYLCPAGIPSIGYGAVRIGGRKVTLKTRPISKSRADELLGEQVRTFEQAVVRLISSPLTWNEFSSLVSFCYNVGAGALQRSTLRQKLNRGDYLGAANQFGRWRMGGGRVLLGLVRRRAEERSLFLA
jgi:lysozyme